MWTFGVVLSHRSDCNAMNIHGLTPEVDIPVAALFPLAHGGQAVGRLYSQQFGVVGCREGLTQAEQHGAQVQEEALGRVHLVEHHRHHLTRPQLGATWGKILFSLDSSAISILSVLFCWKVLFNYQSSQSS